MRFRVCVSVILAVLLLATAAIAQVKILDDPLQTGTSGTLAGGSFTGTAFRIDNKQDGIYWHLSHVVRNGYAQMTVTGMDGLPGGYSKYEIFHSYDADFSSADTSAVGYDNASYKIYLRKEATDKIRSCAVMAGVFNDATSSINPGWGGAHTLKFQWASVTGSLTISIYWDGVLQETKTINNPGQIWNPGTMSVRIGASSRGGTTGAITGATYSNFEVWDNDMTPNPEDSQCTADTIPPGMIAGQTYGVSVTMKNTGTSAWTSAAGYQLAAVGDSDPLCASNRIALAGGDSIATNQFKTFNLTMVAPATTGTYTTDWQMIKGSTLFGAILTKQVQVTYPDSAQFISDTIPATMVANQQYSVSVTMRNTSQNTWTQALEYKLGANDDSDPMGPGRVDLGPSDSIGPNQQKTFDFTLTAPGIPGTYITDWRMVHEGVNWFGDTDTKSVVVTQPAQECGVLLYDTLQGNTSGTRNGGTFAGGGWQTTDAGGNDYIYWHLPRPITHGRAEFYVKGMNPNSPNKNEHFHMYDYTYNNADTVYDGYRNNPYKLFWRKTGADDPPRNNSLECVMNIIGNVFETDSAVFAWNSATTYKMTVEWGPDGKGNTVMNIYRDGALLFSQGVVGIYNPVGHSVRLGAARNSGEGSQPGCVYSYLKVTDLSETVAPAAPAVILPGNTQTTTSTVPVIRWHGDPHAGYQIRVNTSSDPNIGIVWDSGQVVSTASQANCGTTLTNGATYYAFVKLGSCTGWSTWSAASSFKVDTSYVRLRRGRTVVNGTCWQDDGGKFLALGFTHMRGLNRCRFDRDRYMHDMADMGSKGFTYQRVLSMVSWVGLEIIPIDAVNGGGSLVYAWPDYGRGLNWDQTLKDTIDLAYDNYGIRTEICVFADAQYSCPGSTARYQHMDRLLADIAGREHKVQAIEMCNEWYQNGLSMQELKDYSAYIAARTTIPVALSDNGGDMCGMYCGTAADYSTVHSSRDTGNYGWTPVSDVWNYTLSYPGVPPVSSDEPIGPGSSVAEENDPCRLMAAAAFAFIAHVPAYTYHGRFGVTGLDKNDGHDVKMSDTPGFGAYQHIMKLIPNDVSCWTRNDGKEAAAPFTARCSNQDDKYWTDIPSATDGCYANIGGANGTADGSQFVCFPMGIKSGNLTLVARRQLWFTVYNPLTGLAVSGMSNLTKTAGQTITLTGAAGVNVAYLIKGGYGPPPGVLNPPVLTVTQNGTTNNLSWTNPNDVNFAGTLIRYRYDAYPTSPTDGTQLCYRAATPGSSDSFSHTGQTQCVYYAAFSYDGVSIYSNPSIATTCQIPCWRNEAFDAYTNGNIGGQNGWATVSVTSAQVQSTVAKGGTGKALLLDPVPASQPIGNQVSFCDKSSGYFLIDFDAAQDVTGTTGQAVADFTIYGNSSTPIATVHVQKTRMFVEYSAGPSSLATLTTSAVNLTWYNVRIGLNVDTRKLDLWLDGVSKGTNLGWAGDATAVSRIVISSDRNANLNPQKLYIDNLRIETKPGQCNAVTDDGAYSPSLSKLHFAFDSVAGTTSYQYAIGTTSGGTQTRTWTNCGTSTDVTATGLSLAESTATYYVSVQCLNDYGTAGTSRTSNGIKVAPGLTKINDAKALADGTSTSTKSLRGKLVSAAFPGYFYIQEPDGPFGLKIVSPATVAPGDQVDVAGFMQGSALERYMDCSANGVIKIVGPDSPAPLVLRSSSVGGVDLNANTHGIVNGVGPNSVGLYVYACGTVTQRQTTAPMYFYIDDGSGVKDGSTTGGVENVGVRVSADPANYAAGSYVGVKGVVSCFDAGGRRPQLLPQSITALQAP